MCATCRSIVNEAAAASPVQPIVNMGQGFFGYNPPKFVLDAAKAALDQVDCNQYSPTKGRPRLKKAIADAYSPFFGRTLDPDKEVTITTGANEAITPKTRMIVLNSPHNPIGKVFSKDELQKIADVCVKHNIIILSDEVYDRLYYVPFTRVATLSPEVAKLTLTVGSGGKNFYATGWRVGWLIGPEHLIKYVSAAHTRICYSSVSPLQEATAIGFEQADAHNFWDESKKEMKAKMDKFTAVFDELGLPYSDPEGGYFVLVNMSKVRLPDDYEFPPHVAERPRDFKLSWFLIMEVGVAAIPPTEFFTPGNAHIVEDWLRFAVCKDDDVLERAMDRLRSLKKYIKE
ncbi:kynurenine aminotransferase [Pyrenophora seminiperda CCB06]|uniref:Kynurenine aminotransferase n=1 Tax=Pyrenophora seminiperda CCB06 TaxID=1302712 RepID=A0A3M7MIM9_9PLEO|nr:kynurenine aminotransferase [Pyrenophora seminiperda CCB06]